MSDTEQVPTANGQDMRNALISITKNSVTLAASAAALSLGLGNVKSAIADDTPKKQKKPKVLETDLGIKYIDLVKGTGPYINDGDFVVINYSAFLQNGTMFDTTQRKGGKPLSFRYGKKQVIPGVESVLETMQVGGERSATIPAKYAFGDKGVCTPEGCLVPPGATLNYVIKLKAAGAAYN